jgi:hypothetical protein
MTTQHIILLVINIIGGAAVIGSYFFGIRAQSGGANILWGGVPPGVRPVYVVSMLLSALGYFAFIYYLLFRLDPTEVSLAGNLGYGVFYIIFLAMLLPSALWMPLTNVYVANPGTGTWLAVRGVLALVGLASIGLVWALLSLSAKSGAAYWLAVAGSGYFAFHTSVLDAIIWAEMFPQSH